MVMGLESGKTMIRWKRQHQAVPPTVQSFPEVGLLPQLQAFQVQGLLQVFLQQAGFEIIELAVQDGDGHGFVALVNFGGVCRLALKA